LQILIVGALASLLFAMIWGLAAGSTSVTLALANLYKLPMIVLLSAASAVPAALLTWKLSGAKYRATDLMLSFTSGLFSGTLVLAVLSPLVALYYHSSSWAGPTLAVGSAVAAVLVGAVVLVRGLLKRNREEMKGLAAWLPVVVLKGLQIATLLQFIAILSPILPELTPLSRGIDGLFSR
jgi:hypothetical protein